MRKFLHDHVDPGVFAPDAVRTLIAAFDGAWQSILASGARLSAQQRLIHQSEDRPRSRQDNNGSAISRAVEVSIYRFEFIAIAQLPVLNSYPNADLL